MEIPSRCRKDSRKKKSITLAVADDCKVTWNATYDPGLKTITDRGEPLEGGFSSRLVKKSISIFAIITTEGEKGTQVNIIRVDSKHFFLVFIVKIEDANKITVRKLGTGVKAGDVTVAVADDVKVTHLQIKGKKREITPLNDGLKNEVFRKGKLFAHVETDDDDKIVRMKVFMLPAR